MLIQSDVQDGLSLMSVSEQSLFFIEHEDFWLKALRDITPGVLPLSVYVKYLGSEHNTASTMGPLERVSTYTLDTALCKTLTTVCQEKGFETHTFLLSLMLIYFYRLNNYQNYTINFSSHWIHQHKNHLHPGCAQAVPLSTNFKDGEIVLKAAFERIKSIIEQVNQHKTYDRDLLARHADLAGVVEHDLASVFIVDDCNHVSTVGAGPFAIFINTNGTAFSIYKRPDYFPSAINHLLSNIGEQIDVLLKNFLTACNALEKPLYQFLVLTEQEKKTVQFDFNNTAVYFEDKNLPIHAFFEQQVLKTPHSIAVFFENNSLTYEELNQKANQVAYYLKERGLKHGELVGVCAKRSLEMVIALLGILKAGGAYLPLDPMYPIERLSYLLEDSGVTTVLTDVSYPSLQQALEGKASITVFEVVQTLGAVYETAPQNFYPTDFSPTDLAYVIYTSGTTGEPKGVEVTHASLVNHMLWMLPMFDFSEKDVFLQKTSFCFDASVWEFFAPLMCGARLVLASNGYLDYNRLIKKHKITVLQLVPSVLKVLLEDQDFQDCHSLMHVFSGGEALLPSTVRLFHEKTSAKLHNLYGPTEATIEVTSHSYERDSVSATNLVLIGKPISNVQLYVLDRYQQLMPIGVPGELYLGGACLAKGYLNRVDLTQSRFVKSPFDACQRLYKTGDKVRLLEDGTLEYLGRLDDQVKLNGYRIELGEVEANLLKHEEIQECAVVIQERADKSGQVIDKQLIAYYVKHLDLTDTDKENFISTWKTVYQSQYLSLDMNNFKYNIGGWNSSYTDKAIETSGIHEWVNATIERLQTLQPKKILEVGSGSGLVLFNMIDHCEYYFASDFSKNVIDYTKNVVDKFGYSHKVYTMACAADQVPYAELNKAYDTVVINSVIQYFPTIEYLEGVIEQNIKHISDAGKIFIGDVRDFRLLKCFHSSVRVFKRQKTSKAEIDHFSSREKELLVSPDYFLSLKNKYQDIAYVEILPKIGKALHEMNRYRYDVVIHVRKDMSDSAPQCLDEKKAIKISDFKAHVDAHKQDACVFFKYPNKRIIKDYIEFNQIYYGEKQAFVDEETVLSINEMIDFVKPRNKEIKFFVDVHDPLYLLVVVFKKTEESKQDFYVHYNVVESDLKREMATRPLVKAKLLENQFANELKSFLNLKLPAYMVPSSYIPLEKLPLTANGKLDRKALVAPDFIRSADYSAPANETETKLCQIFSEVLGLPESTIGTADDFFNLGGNSLSALRTLALIKNSFLIKVLPTRTLFEYPTIQKLGQLVDSLYQNASLGMAENSLLSPIITLQKEGFKSPLFLIHPIGGTIFCYKLLSRYIGKYRPIYAIQDHGIDAEDLLFHSLQEMASFYLKAIQTIQPHGPYLLAGASFGATVSIEIANQLLKAGEKVNFIGLMDGWPVYSKKFWEKEFFEQLMLQQFQQMDTEFMKDNDFKFLLELQKHRMLLLRYYKLPIINAKLTFFKANELWPVFKEIILPKNCWQPYSTHPVEMHVVPGDHETMFWEPHVQVLSSKINQSLDKIEKEQHMARLGNATLLNRPY